MCLWSRSCWPHFLGMKFDFFFIIFFLLFLNKNLGHSDLVGMGTSVMPERRTAGVRRANAMMGW